MVKQTNRGLSSKLLMVALPMLLLGVAQAAAAADAGGTWQPLSIGNGSNWAFFGGPWSDAEGGVLKHPPMPFNSGPAAYSGQRTTNNDLAQAFYTKQAYGDFEATFKFRWGSGHNGAGIIFRAQDAQHYYLAHFEAIAQAIRASHFWARISKVDGNGWVEVLRSERIGGVPPEIGITHEVRLVVQGNEFRLWVDKRPMSPVVDDSYSKPGYVGVETWGYGAAGSVIQDLKTRGEAAAAPAWDASVARKQDWFLPWPKGEVQQSSQGFARLPDGGLLTVIGGTTLTSSDKGRTWNPLEAASSPGGALIQMPDGRMLAFAAGEGGFGWSESTDGKTWSERVKAECGPFTPPANAPNLIINPPQGFTPLRDGTIVAFQVAQIPGGSHESGQNIWEWGGRWENCAYSIRSTDGGKTWGSPVALNGAPAVGQKWDLCEFSSNVQTKEGKLVSFARPIYAPGMWEIWSEDGGQTWGPATIAPFGCWATTALATADGTILVSGRNPGLGLYVSHDSGMTWKEYRVDTGGLWAMGRMVEVAPGLVFYVYMDHYASYMRGQFIRITEDGAEPVREMLPAELQ